MPPGAVQRAQEPRVHQGSADHSRTRGEVDLQVLSQVCGNAELNQLIEWEGGEGGVVVDKNCLAEHRFSSGKCAPLESYKP